MLFSNKVVVVTGASSGIGRAAALAFAKEGAILFLADVNAEGGGETVQLVKALGAEASYITCDVSHEGEVKTLHDAIIQQHGRLDIALNNAGVGGEIAPVHAQEESVFDMVMDVNVKGVWLCMKYQVPLLRANEDGGAIVNIASVAGLIGFPNNSPYCASKHAVIGLTKAVALEVASKRIRVNAVCPSYINTPMVSQMLEDQPRLTENVQQASPMRRLGSPEEVAEAIVWLASPKASFVNGIALAADGGLTAM
jgi:NAD(P)-dependent dehydrogenase (short-subunit alcohol dehydrogenase family)